MLICTLTVLILALQNSSGFRVTVRDAPQICGQGHQLMGYRVRRTFLEVHNYNRASLAEGKQKLPKAANMRFMAYNCSLEEEATKLTTTCVKFENRTEFDQTRTNFANIASLPTNGGNRVARQAASDWWSQKVHWQNFKNISSEDYKAIPFLLMAQAETDSFGCSVSLCRNGDSSYHTIACIYGKEVEVGSQLYEEGDPCSNCATDYKKCDEPLCKKQ